MFVMDVIKRSAAALAAFGVVFYFTLLQEPYYNWDILMYVGVAHVDQGNSPREAHARTFAEIAQTVSQDTYRDLTAQDGYRDVIAKDPEAFRQQLPFYAVKPLYPGLMALLQQTGMSAIEAGVLIPRVSLALLAALSCFFLCGYLRSVWAVTSVCALVATPYLFSLASYFTPDALSVLLVAAVTFSFLRQERLSLWAGVLMVLALLCRPDTIIYLLSLVVAWAVAFPPERKKVAMLAVICVGTYLGLTHLAGNYGWLTLTYQSFVSANPYPQTVPLKPSFGELLDIYFKQIQPAYSGPVFLMCIVGVAATCLAAVAFSVRSRMFVVAAVCLVTLIAHWVVAPGSGDRLRSGYHFVTLLLLIVAVVRLVAPVLPRPVRDALLVRQNRP